MDEDPVAPDANPDAAPVVGEAVLMEGIIPSAEAQASERQNRIGKTTVQVGTPTALVTIGTWAARLANFDLDPGAGVDLPAEVAAALVGVLTVVLAFRMNRKPSTE